jgi:hypothetical protein
MITVLRFSHSQTMQTEILDTIVSTAESLVRTKNHTQLLQYLPNNHRHLWGIKLCMLCDSVSHYCLASSIYQGAKTNEDKVKMKQFGLAYTVR